MFCHGIAMPDAPTIRNLWRYAIKGLDRDELPSCELKVGVGFPSDRCWALQFADRPNKPIFSPSSPKWIHKENFLCAYTAAELLGCYTTHFDDDTSNLTVSRRSDGQALLTACIADAQGRKRVEELFEKASKRKLLLVSGGTTSKNHHFGNTNAGFKTSTSGAIIHIVNMSTINDVSRTIGVKLHPSRFRPNLVVDGCAPWQEFGWIGQQIHIGEAVLEVVKRTIRCDATHVDPHHGGEVDVLVPELLKKHYPQHGAFLGIYARVIKPGLIKPGETITVPKRPRPVSGLFSWPMAALAVAVLAVAAYNLSRVASD